MNSKELKTVPCDVSVAWCKTMKKCSSNSKIEDIVLQKMVYKMNNEIFF